MRIAYLMVAAALVGCGSGSGDNPQGKSQSAGESSQSERRITVSIPNEERDFMQALLEGAAAYKEAPNELKKSSVKKARDKKLREVTPTGAITGWYGILAEMKTTSEGDAYITVSMPEQLLTLKTWNNAFSDAEHRTLIKNGSPLYGEISNMEVGQYVKVSGQLIKEGSITEEGSMLNPEFIVRFSSVEAVR